MTKEESLTAALENTATDYGSGYYDLFFECPRKFQLKHEQKVSLKVINTNEAQHFAVGRLVHSCLQFAQQEVIDGRDPTEWPKVIEQATAGNLVDPADAYEAERLCTWYFAKYTTQNAGWPSEARIIRIEGLLQSEINSLPITARADSIIDLDGEILIADHKTRKTKTPDHYVDSLHTRAQFLRLAWLYQQKHQQLPDGIWVNVIVKTKEVQLSRHIVKLSQTEVDRWAENQAVLATLIKSQKFLKAPAVMNYSACWPEYFGNGRCEYYNYCHGSDEVRERFYVQGCSF